MHFWVIRCSSSNIFLSWQCIFAKILAKSQMDYNSCISSLHFLQLKYVCFDVLTLRLLLRRRALHDQFAHHTFWNELGSMDSTSIIEP